MRSPMWTPSRIKTRLNLIVTTMVLLAVMVTSIGVGSGCSKDTRAFPELMDTVPSNVSHFTYWNIDDLNGDADLWDIFGRFKESADATQLGQLVQALATIEQSAKAMSSDNAGLYGPATVFRGDFDTAYIRQQLAAHGYSRLPNNDVEVWDPPDNYTYSKAVALRDRTLYLGEASDVIQCVNVSAKGNVPSLREDPNIRLVSNRLPDGVIVEIHRADVSRGEYYADLISYGKSYKKANRDTLSMTAVYMFGDDRAAEEARLPIKDYLGSQFQDITIKRDGNLVVVTSQVPIARFVSTLEF